MSRHKVYRLQRLANGLCAYCGNSREDLTKTICCTCSAERKKQREIRISNQLCPQTGCHEKVDEGFKFCAKCRARTSVKNRTFKKIVLDHYGHACACSCGCGVKNFKHLTVDHINNDGAAQRRLQSSHGGHATYRRIIKSGFPKDLQILCWNCNCAKYYYGGCK